jgi:hypothetical protein
MTRADRIEKILNKRLPKLRADVERGLADGKTRYKNLRYEIHEERYNARIEVVAWLVYPDGKSKKYLSEEERRGIHHYVHRATVKHHPFTSDARPPYLIDPFRDRTLRIVIYPEHVCCLR